LRPRRLAALGGTQSARERRVRRSARAAEPSGIRQRGHESRHVRTRLATSTRSISGRRARSDPRRSTESARWLAGAGDHAEIRGLEPIAQAIRPLKKLRTGLRARSVPLFPPDVGRSLPTGRPTSCALPQRKDAEAALTPGSGAWLTSSSPAGSAGHYPRL